MTIPKDPKERFQYYFDITTGLDSRYQSKIDRVSDEEFSYNPTESNEYKNAVRENADEARYLKNKQLGNYAELSGGYDNSMQEIAEKEINAEEKRANNEIRNALYTQKRRAWEESKRRRIERIKKKYAQEYGNAYYNMLKANEEITLGK